MKECRFCQINKQIELSVIEKPPASCCLLLLYRFNHMNRCCSDFVRPQAPSSKHRPANILPPQEREAWCLSPASTCTDGHLKPSSSSPIPPSPQVSSLEKDPVYPSPAEEEGGASEERENEASEGSPPSETRRDQTYLSCRKTAAPPKRPASRRLRPGPGAASGICRSPGAPYLERGIRRRYGWCGGREGGGGHGCDLTAQCSVRGHSLNTCLS